MIDFTPTGLALAAFAAVLGGSTSSAPSAPIYMVAEPSGPGIHLRVVGAAPVAYDATYRLEVTSDRTRGGNRSTHSSRVRLVPGAAPVTLTTIRLGEITPGRWEARLTVEPSEGEPYQEVLDAL